MMTKLEIRAPLEDPAVYHVFDMEETDLGEDILYVDYADHLYDAYNAYIDDIDGMIVLMGVEYHASEILMTIDEISYRCGFSDWMSEAVDNAKEELNTDGYTAIGDIEITLITDSEEEEE